MTVEKVFFVGGFCFGKKCDKMMVSSLELFFLCRLPPLPLLSTTKEVLCGPH